jgi:hypothetical protein
LKAPEWFSLARLVIVSPVRLRFAKPISGRNFT